MTQTLDYRTPQPPAGLPLRVPAILLIVFGGLTIAAILLDFLSRFFAGSGFHFTFGIHVGSPDSTMCFNAVSLVLLLLMMVGAVQMLRLRSYPLAMTAAILAVVPFTATCCCIFTLPVGIWALVLLHKPPVKASFH